MDTSHLYTAHHCAFSPNSAYIAAGTNNRLVIRTNAIEPAVLHVFECAHAIQYIAWSPDSNCVCTANFDKGFIQVWSLVDTHWRAQIQEQGIRRVWWSPDSSSILCRSDHTMHISVWMLLDQQVRYIKYPKFGDKACESSPDGKYIAVAELHQGKDHVGIYTASGSTLLHRFSADTNDLAGLRWTPDGKHLIVWDHPLYYHLLVFRPDGSLQASYQSQEHGLGIKSVTCSPDSRLLAIGGYDRKIRLLRASDWKLIGELCHTTTLDQRHAQVVLCQAGPASKFANDAPVCHLVSRRPYDIPMLRPDYNAPNPKVGISLCQFSSDSRYLCARDDSMPTALWLWDVSHMSCSLIVIHHQVIRQVNWNPEDPCRLSMCCGSHDIYLIERQSTDLKALSIKASDFDVRKLAWSQNGVSLLVSSKTMFCVARTSDTLKIV